MSNITYANKDHTAPEGTAERAWRDVDANEVKTVVNENALTLLSKQDLAANLTALAALAGVGLVKKTGVGAFNLQDIGTITFGGNRISNLSDPVDGQDADTKAARDAAILATIAALDVQVFKGVIDCSGEPDYLAADAGWTYRVSVAGKIGGAAGIAVQANDMLICLVDSSPSGDQATVGANWVIIHTNTDGMVIGPVSAVDERVAVYDGITGKLIKDGGMTINELLNYADQAASFAQEYAEGLVSSVPVKVPMTVVRTTALPAYNVIPYPSSSRTQLVAQVNGYFPTTDGVLNDLTHNIIESVLVAGESGGNKKYNGTYILLDRGSPTTKWVLMRTLDTQNVLANAPMTMAETTIVMGTIYAQHKFRQVNFPITVDISDQQWEDKTPITSATLNDVLTLGSDAGAHTITELAGISNASNDLNLAAPNMVINVNSGFSLLSGVGDIFIDGFNSVVLSSSGGGAYFAGATETVIGSGVEPISITLPFTVNEGDIYHQGAANRMDALPIGSGRQVVGINAGALAWKQLLYSDLNMTSGFLLGRTSATTGAVELIAAQDGVDISGGNLRLGGAVGADIHFTAAALRVLQFDDFYDFSVQGNNSVARFGFGGNYISSFRALSLFLALEGSRNSTIGNTHRMTFGTPDWTLDLAAGDASNNDGSYATITGGPAYITSGNGKGGGVKLKTGVGHGTGVGGDVILDIASGGLLKFLTIGTTAVTSTTITHNLKIQVGGTDYYICLKTAP